MDKEEEKEKLEKQEWETPRLTEFAKIPVYEGPPPPDAEKVIVES